MGDGERDGMRELARRQAGWHQGQVRWQWEMASETAPGGEQDSGGRWQVRQHESASKTMAGEGEQGAREMTQQCQ